MTFRLQLAREIGRIGLGHHLVQLLGAGLADDLVLVRELVVGDAALDVLAEVRGLDLDAGALLDPEQDVEQVDRLGAEIVHQRRLGGHLVVVERKRLDHRFLHRTVDVRHGFRPPMSLDLPRY
jgi:hypothetical protein